MSTPNVPQRQITLFDMIPLLTVAAGNGVANGIALVAGGGWQRHLVASVVGAIVVILGYVLTIDVARWLDRHWPREPRAAGSRAFIVLVIGIITSQALAGVGAAAALRLLA